MPTCPSCGHAITAQSKFCSQCGAALMAADAGDQTSVIPRVTDEIDGGATADDVATIESLAPSTALLLARRGSQEAGRFLLDGPTSVAGRHENADIFLDDITVSRHHARFTLEAGTLVVEDLGSLNGTYVNRRLIDHPTVLTSGDEVQIGKFKMTAHLGARG